MALFFCVVFAYVNLNVSDELRNENQRLKVKIRKQKMETSSMREKKQHHTKLSGKAFFVLSTGRCGTQTLAEVLNLSPHTQVFHEPEPLLHKEAFYCYKGKADQWRSFWQGREFLITRAWNQNKAYGETYYKSIFFANGIHNNISNAKFIVVVRDPSEVVASGMKTGWYINNGDWDKWRIRPNLSNWEKVDPYEKCCWLWAETYRRILFFVSAIPRENYTLIIFSDMVKPDFDWASIFDFLDIQKPSSEKIAEVMAKKLNSRRLGRFPNWENLPQSYKDVMLQHCGDIAEKFGVSIGG